MNVIFTCGGTGGHINPAIALANTLRERDPNCKILFVGCNATVIPEGVEEIAEGAFASLKRLTAITIPASVEKIGAGAFRDCAFLATFAVEHTEEAFAAVEKGADWNLNCTFEVTYAQN